MKFIRFYKFLSLYKLFAFVLLTTFFSSSSAMAAIGTPHVVYGKVFNSNGTVADEANIEFYAYVSARPYEMFDISSFGSGYDNNGWMWIEVGNFPTPWSLNENIRIIVNNSFLQESGVVDLVLNSSGNQLFPDLYLGSGDNVGPIAKNALVDGTSPASIPEGTGSINLTVVLDDLICGNNNIQSAECYIDTDPGTGVGAVMDPGDGAFDNPSEEAYASIDTSLWTEGSTYIIYARGQDSAGNWGVAHSVLISVVARNDIPATVDIYPKTLNVKSKGKFITSYIELMEPDSVNDIDIASIVLKDGDVVVDSAFLSPAEINDYDSNGISDLMVKFDRKVLIDYLISVNKTSESVEFTVEGTLTTGIIFRGNSAVQIINP